jgi:hypothetical protein
MRDRHEPIAKAERVDDFGGAGEQGCDAHWCKIDDDGRSGNGNPLTHFRGMAILHASVGRIASME